MPQDLVNTFVTSLEELWIDVVRFAPVIASAFVVFVLGWIVAVALGKAVTRLAQVVQLDKLFSQFGVMEQMKKAGLDWKVSTLLGGLVRWFFIIVAFLAAVDLLGLQELSNYISSILLYMPNIIVAALILLVAAVLANFLEKLVMASVKATEVGPAQLVGTVVRWSVWGFAILAALSQLGIANALIEILFMGLVAMLAIAGGLAFGLGGQGVAREVLEKLKNDLTE